MKIFLMMISVLMSQALYAACEASIVEGRHTAMTESEARAGAWEDARDVCYPGDAASMDISCGEVAGDDGIQGEPAVRCTQKASCTLCGDDLQRKYEALD